MTATADIRNQTSDISPIGLKRTPFLVAGAVLATVFAWQSCLLLVREPAHPKAAILEDDYPLEKGMTWVYKAAAGLQVVRRVDDLQTIIMTSSREGTAWFKMHFDLPILGRKSLLMRRTPEGVIAQRDDREQLIMKFPMNPGDSWTIDFPTEDLAECTVLERETITVLGKAATASKLRVVRTHRKNGKKTTDYEWYVRGIGLARMEVTYGLKATFELERFEKAK